MDLKVGAYSEGGTVKAIGLDPNDEGGANSGHGSNAIDGTSLRGGTVEAIGGYSNSGGHWVGHCVVYSGGEDSYCGGYCGGYCIVCSGGEVSNYGGCGVGCELVVDSAGDACTKTVEDI